MTGTAVHKAHQSTLHASCCADIKNDMYEVEELLWSRGNILFFRNLCNILSTLPFFLASFLQQTLFWKKSLKHQSTLHASCCADIDNDMYIEELDNNDDDITASIRVQESGVCRLRPNAARGRRNTRYIIIAL
jgi:hypothetical protein